MKKSLIVVLSIALALTCLAACGSSSGGAPTEVPTSTPAESVDLNAFWDELAKKQEMPAMTEVNDELLESYYPGLKDIAVKQLVVKIPMMSSVVSEYVFVECESDADVPAVQEILQKRVDDQAAGGAWYPDSVENWGKAQVVANGTYVAMIAAGDSTEADVADWNAKTK